VQAAASIVVDLDSGRVLYGKNPDASRLIASCTKIFVAMVVRKKHLDLDAVTEITSVDREHARGGARTHLYEGEHYANGDLLRAMLIASDNRAPTALGRAVGLDVDGLVAEMNALAAELGLSGTHFTDPSGLNGNTSTPRDMAVAMRTLLTDPLLAEIVSTPTVSIVSADPQRPKRVDYRNTNHLLRNSRNKILGGKTGYTDEALYCLVVASEIDGHKVCMVFLGAYGELTRYGDYGRVERWLTGGKRAIDGGDDRDDSGVAAGTAGVAASAGD
jgi:D-alanyl-D-alanine endopeptidase (penicillin-binding protein 7)